MGKYLATYGKPRFLGIVKLGDECRDFAKKDAIIVVNSHRGEELAEIVSLLSEEQESEYRSLRTISEHGEGQMRGGDPVVTDLDFVSQPSESDMDSHASRAEMEGENLRVAKELVEWHKLSIKLIDDEMLLDGKKLFFYFTAEQRVDFRTLVRDLARRFRTRIELRQMGVRDEARIIRGISFCGLPCCCSYWLNQFAPIGIKMVKEQNIALNPSKISGICGRLMCCMSFEHKVYREMWAGLPGPGSKIKTPGGNYIVLSLDIARNAVRCHKPSGGDISVPKDLFADFKQAVMNGEEWEDPGAMEAPLRRNCSSCHSKPSGCHGDASFGYHRQADSAGMETAPPGAEKPDGGDGEAKTATQKRSSRRKGRRGKKPQSAAQVPDKDSTRTPEMKDARDHPRRQPERTEKAVQAAASANASVKRSRRRYPRRPAIKGQ